MNDRLLTGPRTEFWQKRTLVRASIYRRLFCWMTIACRCAHHHNLTQAKMNRMRYWLDTLKFTMLDLHGSNSVPRASSRVNGRTARSMLLRHPLRSWIGKGYVSGSADNRNQLVVLLQLSREWVWVAGHHRCSQAKRTWIMITISSLELWYRAGLEALEVLSGDSGERKQEVSRVRQKSVKALVLDDRETCKDEEGTLLHCLSIKRGPLCLFCPIGNCLSFLLLVGSGTMIDYRKVVWQVWSKWH